MILAIIGAILMACLAIIALVSGPGASIRTAMIAIDPDMLSFTRSVTLSLFGTWTWGSIVSPILGFTSWLTLGLPGILLLVAGLTLRKTA